MRSAHTEALILDVFDLQEQDRIVTFLTREHGKKRGVARGARRKYSRFSGQLQPLARVRVRWFEKDGRDLVRIGEVDLVRPAHRLSDDLDTILLGSYLAEHMTAFAQENEPGDLWFRLLDSTIEALLAGVDRDLAARYFEAWVLRLAGVFPPPFDCPACGDAIDPRQGAVLPRGGDAILCPRCAGGEAAVGGPDPDGAAPGLRVTAPLLLFLYRLGRERLTAMADDPPAGPVLRQAERLAAALRRRFLDRELKSYDVLERIRLEA